MAYPRTNAILDDPADAEAMTDDELADIVRSEAHHLIDALPAALVDQAILPTLQVLLVQQDAAGRPCFRPAVDAQTA